MGAQIARRKKTVGKVSKQNTQQRRKSSEKTEEIMYVRLVGAEDSTQSNEPDTSMHYERPVKGAYTMYKAGAEQEYIAKQEDIEHIRITPVIVDAYTGEELDTREVQPSSACYSVRLSAPTHTPKAPTVSSIDDIAANETNDPTIQHLIDKYNASELRLIEESILRHEIPGMRVVGRSRRSPRYDPEDIDANPNRFGYDAPNERPIEPLYNGRTVAPKY